MRTMANNFRELRNLIEEGVAVDYDNRESALVLYKGIVHYANTHYNALSDYYEEPIQSRQKLHSQKILKKYNRVSFLHDFGCGIAVIDRDSELIGIDEDCEYVETIAYSEKTIKRLLKKEDFKYLVRVNCEEIETIIKL